MSDQNNQQNNPPPPPPPPPQQQRPPNPQDLLATFVDLMPALGGAINSFFAPPADRAAGDAQPAAAAPPPQQPNAQPAPQQQQHRPAVVTGGLGRLAEVLLQHGQMWEQAEQRGEGAAGGMPNFLGQIDELGRQFGLNLGQPQPPQQAQRPAGPQPDPAMAPTLESFIERLTAAAAAGAADRQLLQPGPAAPPPPAAAPPPATAAFNLPFGQGHARIEIVGGIPGDLDQLLRQMGDGFGAGGAGGVRPAARAIPASDLARLPNSEVKQAHVDDGRQCFICMDNFTEVGERVAEMTCAHIFHTSCIVPWLKQNTTCPVCRAEVDSSTWKFEEMELD